MLHLGTPTSVLFFVPLIRFRASVIIVKRFEALKLLPLGFCSGDPGLVGLISFVLTPTLLFLSP